MDSLITCVDTVMPILGPTPSSRMVPVPRPAGRAFTALSIHLYGSSEYSQDCTFLLHALEGILVGTISRATLTNI